MVEVRKEKENSKQNNGPQKMKAFFKMMKTVPCILKQTNYLKKERSYEKYSLELEKIMNKIY